MWYIEIDDTSRVVGYYPEGYAGELPPLSKRVEVTQEEKERVYALGQAYYDLKTHKFKAWEFIPTLSESKAAKLNELEQSFDERVVGSFTTTQGYVMQFAPEDSLKMEGAVRLLAATGAATGYITQANDVTVYDLPLATLQAVLIEMLSAYAQCHARKQELRAAINAAKTKEELDAITIAWPI